MRPRVPINVYACARRQETDRGIHVLLCIRACLKVVWLAPGTGWKSGGGSRKRSNRSSKRDTEEEEEDEISNIIRFIQSKLSDESMVDGREKKAKGCKEKRI